MKDESALGESGEEVVEAVDPGIQGVEGPEKKSESNQKKNSIGCKKAVVLVFSDYEWTMTPLFLGNSPFYGL